MSDTAREPYKEKESILRGQEGTLEKRELWVGDSRRSKRSGKRPRKAHVLAGPSAVTFRHSTRGRQGPVPTVWAGSVRCWGLGPGAVLTMTISPGIGVGSLSRNLTFSSLTGTSSARLSAEMVSSAGLLLGSAVSTAASVCRRGR